MTRRTFYTLDGGDLRISREDPPIEWRGRIDAMTVVEVQPSADGASAVVLMEPPAGSASVRNLVKVNANAEILWRGELPSGATGDSFVSFSAGADGAISASTWSGYRVLLSVDSGILLDQEFTK